jgi:DNA topoisomerase-2
MNTPILKARKQNKELVFYNDAEYETWKEKNDNGKGWKIKYYKGLGTSTSKEFKEYFKDKKIVTFDYTDKCNDHIDMAFNKKRADDRKEWLSEYDRNDRLDNTKEVASYTNYIKKNLIHFSKYDNERSIPNLMDGLKISTRKILYSAFKKKLTNEIKVSQFSGYVSEHSNYHHGEMSLNGAIVNLAQDFVGSNNINLFQPNGQFGTRLLGGADSASERYICTCLSKITRNIFKPEDDMVLDYVDDDGKLVEPRYYAPILPMILVNGSKGIGTGFSTDIPCYNKDDLIYYLMNKLEHKANMNNLVPYYEGFKGMITEIKGEKNKWLVKGVYEKDLKKQKIMIKELPIGIWTTKYKEYLEKLIHDKKIIKDVQDMSTDKTVDITLTFHKGQLDSLLKCKGDYGCDKLEKVLKLYTTLTTNNMNLFTADDKLKHYDDIYEIIDDYYQVRLDLFDKRKQYQIKSLTKLSDICNNKVRYINEMLNDTLELRRKTKQDIFDMLENKQYLKVEDKFDYLLNMPMYSVCKDKVDELKKEKINFDKQLDYIKTISAEDLWKSELKNI